MKRDERAAMRFERTLFHYSQGMREWEIQEVLGISETSVRRFLRRGGIPSPRPAPRPPDWEADLRRSQIRASYREGRTTRSIAEEHGVSIRTVERCVSPIKNRQPKPGDWARAQAMIRAGRSISSTRALCGVSQSRLRRWAREQGVFIRKPGQYLPVDRTAGAGSFNGYSDSHHA